MKITGKILKVVYQSDKSVSCLVEVADTKDVMKVDFKAEDFTLSEGDERDLEVYFKVFEKQTADKTYHNQVVRCSKIYN